MTNTANKYFYHNTNIFSFKKWLPLYSLSFVSISLILWHPFYLAEKSMIWGYDGLYQTYGTMVYFSRYWREFFSNLLSGSFCLPMADASVGLGADILTTLNYYGFGDPLLWISVLFPQEKMEWCYNLLTFLRYYLAGLTFGIYGWRMGKKTVSTLGGSFVYIFCGFALYAGVRHPYFMNPWIYFPLLCLGVEQIFQGKKGTLLAVAAAVSACSNFYFFYMLTILAFLYAVIRFIALYHKQWKKQFVRVFLPGCGWYFLGIALAAVILLPDIFAILSSARVGSGAAFANTWFAYPPDFYKQLLAGYLFPVYQADYWCVLVYPAAAFMGLLVLTNRKREKENLWLGVWFLILTLLLWIPLGGLAMNGFSYVSHRWVFSYSFCIALLFILGVEKAEAISVKGLLIYTGLFFCFAWIFFKNSSLSGGISRKIGAGFCIIFFISILSVFLLYWKISRAEKTEKQNQPLSDRKTKDRKTVFYFAMVLCVVLTSILSARSLYSDAGAGYAWEFQDSGKAWESMTSRLSEPAVAKAFLASEASSSKGTDSGETEASPDSISLETVLKSETRETSRPSQTTGAGIASVSLTPIPDGPSSFSRLEGDTPQETNWGMISGIHGANSYFSLTRRELYDYSFALENPDLKFPSWYNGFGERAALLSLNCVRYFTKMEDGTMAVPYGYTKIMDIQNLEDKNTGILYESPNTMPIGYTYDQIMCRQDWEKLPVLKKQQSFMQAAVLDAEAISQTAGLSEDTLPEASQTALEYSDSPLAFTVTATDGILWDQEKGSLSVLDGGGQITVSFKEKENSETYLRVCGFDIETSGYELLHFFVGAEGTQEKKIYCTSSTSAWDGKLKDFLVLVSGGTVQADGSQTARIRFPFSGEFGLERLEMYSLSMDSFSEQAEARKKESLDATLCQNQIKGTIQVLGDRILCIAVPYSEGWSATVDGHNVPVWKCNAMHLGIFLEEGTHQVVFSYQTPGLASGAIITLLALLLLAVFLLAGIFVPKIGVPPFWRRNRIPSSFLWILHL